MYRKNQLKDSFFDNINGRSLDKYQRKAILNDSRELLVVAAAGSGKTLTIVGKIKYLIEKLGIPQDKILCLSFTNETVNNLKSKLNYAIDTFTFHKLALNILKEHHFKYYINNNHLLEYIVNEFFLSVNGTSFYPLLCEYFDNIVDYNYIITNEKLSFLKQNILSFIRMIKCNNLIIKDLYQIKDKLLNDKEKIFFIIAMEILLLYEEEMHSMRQIDFDDMIIYARDLVKEKGMQKKYQYIIIDEYQDISKIRFSLIREILNFSHARIMCVGDDYQSIYGFSGSSIELFIDFFKYFPKGVRVNIKNTYRNSYQLIHASVKFIMKNPYQLRKNIHAVFLHKHPIVLVYYEDNYREVYQNLLNYLYLEEHKELLVLGRYNRDLEEVRKEEKGLNIRYLTVHMAKGLESENVILLRMENKYLGFPSKITNNKIFRFFNNKNEEIDYAEERRLFYVALTRCKEKVYLLVSRKNPSIFIKEIQNDAVELLLS